MGWPGKTWDIERKGHHETGTSWGTVGLSWGWDIMRKGLHILKILVFTPSVQSIPCFISRFLIVRRIRDLSLSDIWKNDAQVLVVGHKNLMYQPPLLKNTFINISSSDMWDYSVPTSANSIVYEVTDAFLTASLHSILRLQAGDEVKLVLEGGALYATPGSPSTHFTGTLLEEDVGIFWLSNILFTSYIILFTYMSIIIKRF